MGELTERIETLRSLGVVDEAGYRDLRRAVSLVSEVCGIGAEDERLAPLATHLAAAFGRGSNGEAVCPLGPQVLADVKGSPLYPRIVEICDALTRSFENSLSEDERDFLLVHVGGLLAAVQAQEGGEDS